MPKSRETVQHHIDEKYAYFQALGRFVHEFTLVENALAMTLWTFSGVEQSVARAIFSGVRMDAAMSYINRIMEVENSIKKMRSDFQYAFTQLGHINQARNQILHYGVNLGFVSDGEFILEASEMIATNKFFALTEDRVRETPVSGKILDDMIGDLAVIRGILVSRIMWFTAVQKDDSYSAQNSQQADRMMQEARKIAWRYKPDPQSSRRGKRPSKSPKRKRPPQSSRA